MAEHDEIAGFMRQEPDKVLLHLRSRGGKTIALLTWSTTRSRSTGKNLPFLAWTICAREPLGLSTW